MNTLDTKLEQEIAAIVSYIGADPEATEEWAVTQLKSLIKSTLLDALPKEKKIEAIRYYNTPEEMVDIENELVESRGWNACLDKIKDSLNEK